MCDDSESRGKMRRKAYVSEEKHENRILERANCWVFRAKSKEAMARLP